MMSTEAFDRALGPGHQIAETVHLEDQGTIVDATQMIAPSLDLSNLSFSIKSTDMSESLILYIVEKTILAFESSKNSVFNKDDDAFQQDQDTAICT